MSKKINIPLIVASSKGEEDTVISLLDRGADINEIDSNGNTALINAVTNNNKKMVELLLNRGADTNKKNNGGYTALMRATDNIDIVKLLLDKGADIDAADNNGTTALVYSIINDNIDMVELLLNRGADTKKKNNHGDTAIIMAVIINKKNKNNKNIIEMLLKKDKNNTINIKNNNEETALTRAIYNQNYDIIDLLLSKGAKIGKIYTEKEDIENMSKIMAIAVINGNENMVKLTLDSGANIDEPNINGDAALIFASGYNNFNIVKLLLDRGADINIQNRNEDTALMFASANNNFNIVKLLLDRGADINMQNIQGDTALIIAAINGNKKMVELLLDRGADINIKNNKEETALARAFRVSGDIVTLLLEKGAKIGKNIEQARDLMFKAIYEKNENMVKLLLDRGADINEIDTNGDTALIIAVDNDNKKMVELLLSRGANIDIKDNDWETALIHAVKKQNTDIVKLLLDKGANIDIKNRLKNQTALELANKKIKELIENFIKNDPKAIKAAEAAEKLLLESIEKEEGREKKKKVKKKKETGLASTQPSESVPDSIPEPLKSEPLEIGPSVSEPITDSVPEPLEKESALITDKEYEQRIINIKRWIDTIEKKHAKYKNNLIQINFIQKAIVENNYNKISTEKDMIQMIQSASLTDAPINLKDLQGIFNKYIADNNRKKKEIEQLNADNNVLKAKFGNSYFYIGSPICDTPINECGMLQLQIDLNKGEQIKIHGIFPYEGDVVSDRRKIQVDFFDNYQNEEIYGAIEQQNFLSFFKNIELFDKSISRHNKYTIQNKESFINNTIFLSEAIMLQIKSEESKTDKAVDIDWYIKTLHSLPPIWGFSHFDEKEYNKIKVYFKVCFNNVTKIWQLCNSRYDPRIKTDGFSNKSNKILIKKSIRRSKMKPRSKKSIKKTKRRSRIKPRSKKSIKKSKRRSKKSIKKLIRRSKKCIKKSRRRTIIKPRTKKSIKKSIRRSRIKPRTKKV